LYLSLHAVYFNSLSKKKLIRKDSQGIGRDQIWVLSWYLPVGVDKDYEELCFLEGDTTGYGLACPVFESRLVEQIPDNLWRPMGTAVISPGYHGRGVKLTTHLHIAQNKIEWR
jgi:hypothetical protein